MPWKNINKEYLLKKSTYIIIFLTGLLLGNGGILWKSKQAKLEQKRYKLNVLHESINIMEKKELIYKKIVQLNNEYYKLEKDNAVTIKVKELFESRYKFLMDNFYNLEYKLATLENRKIKKIVIPSPLKNDFVSPPPPRNVRVKLVSPSNFFYRIIEINVFTFLLILIAIVILNFLIFNLYFVKIKKVK